MAAEPAVWREFAPAKVNLFLHVRGRRADGYHLLESLAVFPQVGDSLEARPAAGLTLTADGPFGAELDCGPGNLVLRAARGAGASGLAFRLTKRLPVASGIGGGSSDAAAALRIVARAGFEAPPGFAPSLGADVPVCLEPGSRIMSGVGEQLAPGPRHPAFWMLLVNPGVAVATGPVFDALATRDNPPGPAASATGFADFHDFIAWLALQRNDLEAPARRIAPAIGEVLAALGQAPLARMSGSGASCFALFETERAARGIDLPPGWWSAVARVPAHGG